MCCVCLMICFSTCNFFPVAAPRHTSGLLSLLVAYPCPFTFAVALRRPPCKFGLFLGRSQRAGHYRSCTLLHAKFVTASAAVITSTTTQSNARRNALQPLPLPVLSCRPSARRSCPGQPRCHLQRKVEDWRVRLQSAAPRSACAPTLATNCTDPRVSSPWMHVFTRPLLNLHSHWPPCGSRPMSACLGIASSWPALLGPAQQGAEGEGAAQGRFVISPLERQLR